MHRPAKSAAAAAETGSAEIFFCSGAIAGFLYGGFVVFSRQFSSVS